MKIQIKKLQYGGFAATKVPPTTGLASLQTQLALGVNLEDLLPKAVLSDLIQKGLPSDVLLFYNTVAHFQQDFMGGFVNKSLLYQIPAISNRIIQNANYMEKAEERATSNAALDDYAIDLRGFIYVENNNGLVTKKSFADFDSKKDRAMSVSDLINRRKFDTNMANLVDVLNTINNSVGLEKINEYILKILEKVGKATTKLEAYIDVASVVGSQSVKEPSSTQKLAIELLYEEMSKNGEMAFVKMTLEHISKNVNEAFSYIYSILPKNMKMLLEGTYIVNGGLKGKGTNYSAEIIKLAMLMNNEVTNKVELSNPIKLNEGSGDGESNRFHRLGMMEVLLNSDLNKTDWKLVDGGTTLLKFNNATVVAGVPTNGGGTASNVPLRLALDAGIGTYLDYSKIYFGDLKVSELDLSKAILGNEDSGAIYAPIDDKGNLDFSRLEKFEAAEKEIKENPTKYQTDQLKTLVHYNLGSPGKYVNGELIAEDGKVAKFFVTMVTTSDDVLEDDTKYRKSVDESLFEDLLDEIYENEEITKYGYEDPFNATSDYYKVPVFIKIKDFAAYDAAVYSGHGPLERSTNTLYQRAKQLELSVNPVFGNSQILFLQQ